jgi:uncharacterized protein YbjQ (UPF0145 family)
MKKAIVSVLVLGVLVLAGCKTTDITTNKVGWSNYADLSVKDYDVLGIISVESQEVYECSPLGFNKSLKGARITWSDLMAEAAKLGADDVINIRTEVTDRNNRIVRFLEFFTGYTLTYYYRGTGLAIKYTGSVERGVSPIRIGSSDTLPRSSGPEREFVRTTQ